MYQHLSFDEERGISRHADWARNGIQIHHCRFTSRCSLAASRIHSRDHQHIDKSLESNVSQTSFARGPLLV
jgi:hypothetical protein